MTTTAAAGPPTTAEKMARLRALLRARAPLVVAYSGGVDSTFLLAVAAAELGDGVLAVIADSPSLPRRSLAAARQLAGRLGAAVQVLATRELEQPQYASNPLNRCYFCKTELFTQLADLARTRGFRAIAYGENADDLHDVRPGRTAAAEFGVIAPLREAGLTKAEIRAGSRAMGLPTADAPAQPCLSSRIPHGTPVTAAALDLIERGEEAVRARGFRVFRVRHLTAPGKPPVARVQIAPGEMDRLADPATAAALVADLRAVGYAEVEIDPQGYRGPSTAA